MGNLSITNAISDSTGKEAIRVNKAAGKIDGHLSLMRFKDKDTNQIIIFCPSLDITGYGDTSKKAGEMLTFSIREYLDHLIKLPSKQIEAELNKFGWKKNRLSHKQYSKAYVDINGELQNFNAVDNKVERLTLHAA
jgi:hypothetical protein